MSQPPDTIVTAADIRGLPPLPGEGRITLLGWRRERLCFTLPAPAFQITRFSLFRFRITESLWRVMRFVAVIPRIFPGHSASLL